MNSKNLIILFILIFISVNSSGQDLAYSKSDSSAYYYKTDFQKVDSIHLWNFRIDTSIVIHKSDSIHSIGKIYFWRTKSIDDGISKSIYNKLWTPQISFDIYKLSGKIHCEEVSNHIRYFSSCTPPNVGGDLLSIGNYILLNRDVCLSCERYDTEVDYCRPLLNKLFGNIDDEKIISLKSLESEIQFFLKKALIKIE